MMDNK